MSNIAVSAPKIGFVSLGCPKALVDSERIMTQLRADGYELVASYAAADLVVVNTCGFIDSAKAESLATIGEAVNENGKVIVTGCLGVQADEIRSLHPRVLSVTGPQQYAAVVEAVHTHLPFVHEHNPYIDLVPPQGIKLTPRHYAYLKISEGCNHKCSFCIIPSMRGKLASRPIGEVMDEAQRLVDSGVRELLIISQDTSAYGSDIKYRTGFWQGRPLTADMLGLCRALGELGVWVRLHYVYPYPHVDQVIPLMADGLILPYLDIPFQHGSPRILKQMRRPAHAENALNRIARWREICPDITLRSTFIVGFPGETDEDFDLLLDFIEAAELDRVGCFQYSPVAGAAANELPGAVSDAVKEARWNEFMQCQQVISRERLARRVGQSMQVLVDSITDDGPVGRSSADAPEIDGVVHLSGAGAQHVSVGELYTVTISDADDYDLYGVVNAGN
ncbi:MAG: 30S ribosomal protein S12 methylthiotransferase RimO [Proteobacteria bacterium]|nr:30S ribosomal protein S12 methylthiotransferase RimO [Pseudomonadota bacterium]